MLISCFSQWRLCYFFFFLIYLFPHLVYGGPYGTSNQTQLYAKRSFNIGDLSLLYLYVSADNFSLIDNFTNVNSTSNNNSINNVTNVMKAISFPTVDQFSIFNVNGSGMDLRYSENVSIWVDYHGSYSSQHYYRNNFTSGYFVGAFVVVIHLTNGLIQSVTWDDFGCGECSSSECIADENCGIENSQANNCDNPSSCNLNLYIVWMGTDASGNELLSAQYRPTLFAAYSLYPMYQAASGVAATRFFQPNS
jgi:hypothetical protein